MSSSDDVAAGGEVPPDEQADNPSSTGQPLSLSLGYIQQLLSKPVPTLHPNPVPGVPYHLPILRRHSSIHLPTTWSNYGFGSSSYGTMSEYNSNDFSVNQRLDGGSLEGEPFSAGATYSSTKPDDDLDIGGLLDKWSIRDILQRMESLELENRRLQNRVTDLTKLLRDRERTQSVLSDHVEERDDKYTEPSGILYGFQEYHRVIEDRNARGDNSGTNDDDNEILADNDGKRLSLPDVICSAAEGILDDEDGEKRDVLQYLKSNVINTGYKPMPDELVEAINELFERNNVEFAVIAQSPGDWRKVTVVGAGVEEAFKTDADQYEVIKKYSEFTVTPQNKNVPRQTKHYAGWERPCIWEKRSKCYKDVWEKKNWTSCELLVEANEKNKVNNRQAVYAVVPAHLLLTEKQRKEATLDWVYPSAAGNACSAGEDGEPISTIEKARFEVERKTTKRSYSIHWKEGDEDMKTDLSHPALLAYRQWFCKQSNAYLCPIGQCAPVHALCPHMFINDIALLQLDRDDARQLQMTLNEKLQSKAPILDIATNEQLNMLCSGEFQYNIEIKGYTGVTHPKLRLFYPGRVYGKYLAFYITSDLDSAGHRDKLKDGDCGLMVYMKGNDHSRTILGMFIGEYEHQIEGEPVVYQAIILSQALKNIGLDYPHHVNKIRQFTTAGARPPRLQQRRFSSR